MSEALREKSSESEMAVRRESPLHYVIQAQSSAEGADCGVLLKEFPLKGHLSLRGNPDNELFLRGTEEVLGLALPTKIGESAASGETQVYCLSPNEWLLVVVGGTEAELERCLRESLNGHFAVVDLSGGQTLMNLSGKDVLPLLQKSSGYDFHPSHFGAGRCVQTTFAKAGALVCKKDDGSFDLVIRRSFADYLFKWIADASAEYGFRAES